MYQTFEVRVRISDEKAGNYMYGLIVHSCCHFSLSGYVHGENGDVACDGYHKYKVNTIPFNLFSFAQQSIDWVHLFEEN